MTSTYLSTASYELLDKSTLVLLDPERAAATAEAFSDLETIRFMGNGELKHGVVLKTAVRKVTGKTRGPENDSTRGTANTPEAKEAL